MYKSNKIDNALKVLIYLNIPPGYPLAMKIGYLTNCVIFYKLCIFVWNEDDTNQQSFEGIKAQTNLLMCTSRRYM